MKKNPIDRNVKGDDNKKKTSSQYHINQSNRMETNNNKNNTYQYDQCPHYNGQRLVVLKDGPSNRSFLDIVFDNLELFVEIQALQ